MQANIALLQNNAAVAAEIARALLARQGRARQERV
jgi:pseudouridine-5'-phosphate glycosidase